MNWAAYVENGKPFDDVYIFDVHGHIGGDIRLQLGNHTADDMVNTLDRLGVNSICVSPILAFASDWVRGNELALDAVKKHPGRIYAYATPSPFYEDCDLSRYLVPGNGILGIKAHGEYQAGTPLCDRRFDPAYEIADQKRLPVLFHAWTARQVAEGMEVASRFPNANFIFAHVGFTDADAKAGVITGAKKYDNVYIDTAISSSYDGTIEYLVNRVGDEKVLYGSDCSFFDCCHTLGKLALSRLSDTQKEKILGQNAKKLFAI